MNKASSYLLSNKISLLDSSLPSRNKTFGNCSEKLHKKRYQSLRVFSSCCLIYFLCSKCFVRDCRILNIHFMKSVRIRSYSGPYFHEFGLNTDRYSVSLRIQSKCGKMRTRITPNTDNLYVVIPR